MEVVNIKRSSYGRGSSGEEAKGVGVGSCLSTTEGSEILSHLHANQSACHSFMEAGRRHKTPASETKNRLLDTALVVLRVLSFIWSPEPQFSQSGARRARWYLYTQRKYRRRSLS